MVLKHHENEGRPAEELPIVEWACRELLYQAQEQLHSVLRNFPNRALAAMMRLLVFPRGLTYFAPSDRLGHNVADLVLKNTATRARLTRLVYRTAEPGNPLGALQQALELADAAEPLERRLRIEGHKTGSLTALDLPGQIEQARALGILSEAEARLLADYDRRVMQIIDVDDFAPHELGLAATRTFPRAITPTPIDPTVIEPTAIEGDRPCAY
jgi:acyl-CoA dehydrogenase